MTEREALGKGTEYRQNSWRAFKFVLQFLKPCLKRMLLVCLIDISVSVTNLTIPWLGKTIIDRAFPERDWNLVLTLAAGVAALAALVYGLVALRTFIYNTVEMLLGLEIRKAMYRHMQKLSLETLESIPIGQQQFRITTDADRIAHMLVRILPTLTMLVEFTLILVAAIYVDPILTGIVMAFLVPWTALFVWVTHYGRILDRKRLRFIEMRDSGILQASSSFPIIKSFGNERLEVRRGTKANVAVQRVAATGYLILVGFEFFTQKLLPYVKSTTIYVYLARKVVLGEMTLGMTVPMIAYLSRLSVPLERIVNFGCWIWQTMVSAERMMQIMTTEPAVQDVPNAARVDRLTGHVKISQASFDRLGVGLVLDKVDLDLTPGKLIAVVGPSGAGKSTLIGLILRFFDPIHGTVEVDGHDIKKLDRTTYLRNIGTVMQESFVFGGSVADNLRLAKPDATDQELVEALSQVELQEWLSTLPDGLSTSLEGGLGISAGQKQRIGVARAILANPAILLLDEPTSALDSETESQIMETLSKLSEGRSTLLVTHRLNTARIADEILVMETGKVVQRGTHDELVAVPGLYQDLFRLHQTLERSSSAGVVNL